MVELLRGRKEGSEGREGGREEEGREGEGEERWLVSCSGAKFKNHWSVNHF